MKLSCQEHLVPGDTFAERLASLEGWGYQGVELTSYEGGLISREDEIKAALADSPVQASTICGGHNAQFIHRDQANREETVRQLRQLLKLAAAVGANGCIAVPLFNRDPRVLSLEPYAGTALLQRNLLVSILRPLAKEAADLGVCILIEPLIRYESDFPKDLCEAASICDEIDSAGMKLMADFFHMNVEEADIAATLLEGARHVGHVHFADSNRRPVGNGHTLMEPIADALREIGYDGCISAEAFDWPDPDAAAKQTIDSYRKYFG